MPPIRRPHVMKVRLSDEEFTSVRARAALVNRTPARYVREAALGVVPSLPRGLPDRYDAEVLQQLRRIGNNLNQLAREANAGREFPAEQKLDAALAELMAVAGQLGARTR